MFWKILGGGWNICRIFEPCLSDSLCGYKVQTIIMEKPFFKSFASQPLAPISNQPIM